MSPFIFLVSFSEWVRSHTHHVYELELTTTFSFKAVMLARVGLMNILNIVAITVLIFTVVSNGTITGYFTGLFLCLYSIFIHLYFRAMDINAC